MRARRIHGVITAGVVMVCVSLLCVYNSTENHRPAGTSAAKEESLHTQSKARRQRNTHLHAYTSVVDQKTLNMHCNCCALVTSSGQLTGSLRGEEIDRTECVIRTNDAPTRGYGPDVGRRTTLRVVAHSSVQRVLRDRRELLDSGQDTTLVVWGPSSCMKRDGKGLVYNRLRLITQLLPRLPVFTVSRLKMLQQDELFRKETGKDRRSSNTWLSTGWFTMVIAMEICDRIDVYGMVPADFCESPSHLSKPYHYYEPAGPDECSVYLTHERDHHSSRHRFLTEKQVFARWAQTSNIHFYQPDWRPDENSTLTAALPRS